MTPATKKDFKMGTKLTDEEGNEFIIKDKYDEGIWETNKGNVVFEREAKFYTIE